MCGIIAVLGRKGRRAPPASEGLLALLSAAERELNQSPETERLNAAANALGSLDRELRGTPGLWTMLNDDALVESLLTGTGRMRERVAELERAQDRDASIDVEQRNAALVRIRDGLWAIQRDRTAHAKAVRALAGGHVPHQSAAAAFSSLQTALAALDRLEVRGRDSAGLSVIVSGVDLKKPHLKRLLTSRTNDELFRNKSTRWADGSFNFVYKHAAEIGELGDNVAALRDAIISDDLLQASLREREVQTTVLGHTRWASVGIISQANAHPLNHEEVDGPQRPYVIGALNGDVDNHHELIEQHALHIPDAISTDAKVIPVLVSREMQAGHVLCDAFRRTVGAFEGSVAIGAASTASPDQLALALRGSGQALYVGLAEDMFVVASEPYGVVEHCDRYLRMDGETAGNPDNAAASRGQVVVLDRAGAGDISGIKRLAYDATKLSVAASDLAAAGVTTRDIDRGDHPHYLMKEISESPGSLEKTLRGRVSLSDGRRQVTLPESSLPPKVACSLKQGRVRRIIVIGQGTAAVAGQAIAGAIADAFSRTEVAVEAKPATELSGFGMADDMSDHIVVAISQSGTTTDTNRTVDLVRSRGAVVIAVVNRRGSDLTDKADGVVYTSDGRDVEMSVASTKAFYAQCAAGQLLALALARAAGYQGDASEHELLGAMLELPAAMREVLSQDERITELAGSLAPPRRYWALVGNGKNHIAAAEIRIKLSELCYKSIACDATEDKKHIDLSSEPMILCCAAGMDGSTADDVAKEVAIYKAHKAAPIVIATTGQTRFDRADGVIEVPDTHPSLAYILSTMAGHLFGYRAALAIDELATPLRRMRVAIEATCATDLPPEAALHSLAQQLRPHWKIFRSDLSAGRYDGTLEASAATKVSSLCSYALALTPLDSFAAEHGQPGTPGAVIDSLTETLTTAIDQLTRPIDAIKHQAKTVTVGISRSDEALLVNRFVKAALAAGASRDHLSYADLRALASIERAVASVLGSTRYAISGSVDDEGATITVIERSGVAAEITSRTEANPELRGTKHLVASEKKLMVARGRNDGRIVVIVPEVKDSRAIGLTLIHVKLHERLPASDLRSLLSGYRNRYQALADAVTETEPSFEEDQMAEMSVADLLCEPIYSLADRWRNGTLNAN